MLIPHEEHQQHALAGRDGVGLLFLCEFLHLHPKVFLAVARLPLTSPLVSAGQLEKKMPDIQWDEPATLIDLDGKAPMIGTIRECVMHFAIFNASAKEQARILLTRPVHRVERRTRTWILEPGEIEDLSLRL